MKVKDKLGKLVNLYYSDDWEKIASQGGNATILKGLLSMKKNMPASFWRLLDEGWFHDAYIIQLECDCRTSAYSLQLCIQHHGKKVNLIFSSVTLFQFVGNFLDVDACFPRRLGNKPMAQILDIWAEASDQSIFYILLDNGRYLHIRCKKSKQVVLHEEG